MATNTMCQVKEVNEHTSNSCDFQREESHENNTVVLENGLKPLQCEKNEVKPLQCENNKGESYKCTVCNKEFGSSTTLSTHSLIHSGNKQFECDICEKKFTYKGNLVTHQRTHTKEKPHVCQFCGKGFTQACGLSTHQEKCKRNNKHLNKSIVYKVGDGVFIPNGSLSTTSMLINNNVSIVEMSPNNFWNKQLNSGNLIRLNTNGVNVENKSRKDNECLPYKCSICNKGFNKASVLYTHKMIHLEEKSFECQVCKKQFTYKGNLVTHLRIHTKEKPFHCGVCGKEFSQSCSLSTHMKLHTHENMYKCSFCEKEFCTKGNMMSHMWTHTGHKAYVCKICGATFTQAVNLATHVKTHGNSDKDMTTHTNALQNDGAACGYKNNTKEPSTSYPPLRNGSYLEDSPPTLSPINTFAHKHSYTPMVFPVPAYPCSDANTRQTYSTPLSPIHTFAHISMSYTRTQSQSQTISTPTPTIPTNHPSLNYMK